MPSTNGSETSRRRAFALDLATRVGDLLLGSFRRGLAAERKARGIVTSLDRDAEALIAGELAAGFAGDGLLSEEGAVRPSATGWSWIVDPLDGTTNFVSGLPMFAVSLAAVDPEGTAVGVVHAPALGSTFWAERDGGAGGRDGRLQASPATDLGSAVFLVNKAYAAPTALWEVTAPLLPALRASRMFGCISLDLALVAAGWVDGLVLLPTDPWDVAAGALLVEEAGGRISDLEGEPLPTWKRTSVLAAGAGIHAAALAKLRG